MQMIVSKKVNGAYEEVGKVEVPYFLLSEFGIAVEPTGRDTTGMPVYATDKLNAVFSAVVAMVKADARNKLVSGSIALKPGCTIAQNIDELLAKTQRSGEALALHRAFVEAFTKYLVECSGKKQGVQLIYLGMVKAKASIALSSEARKEGLLAQLEAFQLQASADEQTKFQTILDTLGSLCSDGEEIDDGDL